ncbi:four-carbon acid sugar kinase family protein [Pelagicoccus sp. SDUM812005]|uniref:four-carbon acid sugar kinase family protein n=1 Tax=Pelagicoccus sp. SDUM812005 TaxID=3041257 RepID=UPI00280F6EFA|nr:four-carbon acid sugar kinase family protein [Pelagicoccus sp. SDUM812005]MDQ8179365.1 four-carbon acid sugar kinase family protein [Pelagicoccus sp. SDUM812005]
MSLKIAYYADDFTGSTDALEFLTREGARTVLFVEPPSREQLARYGKLDAIGVAGLTRSMAPERMEERLLEDFARLEALEPRHVHYKVCSTFDSSPKIGNIGQAIEAGLRVFKNSMVPLVVGAPALGRYVAFGNLFARLGIGSRGNIYRLDRHPSTSRHPVTPMTEADLMRHLARQTDKRMGLIDFTQLESGEADSALQGLKADGCEVVFFDTLNPSHLEVIGRLLDSEANGSCLFSVGSSGVEAALGSLWAEDGLLAGANDFESLRERKDLLVISGSCSPVTGEQIDRAISDGFAAVSLDTSLLVDAEGYRKEISRAVEEAVSYLAEERPTIVHSAKGPEDPRIDRTEAAFARVGVGPDSLKERSGALFGGALGEIARECIQRTGIKRLLVSGGDSSSYAARAMGIEAVEMIAPLVAGAPICRAHAPDSPLDGVEVNFKGGQVGGKAYFSQVAKGCL